ncbi:hypothetical protein G7B40_010245 [Aetokthonos hydrillicola Thurmond2011]|jgi:hypothetical protein|uniref:Uncharacterized protein n=1 Tax=Aetokthonos hydrillicola Thurmond2011 TaxID=2712845 RepID=A0AAP5I9K3_9CYAN|nr:hypothetical protein [Aetokthonos hydrillicola]MBO3458991.1 hypothetical protein [Aetokthonos hydrillicola CCALA 1050]MBW4589099.1 hypothetical protein [Aetokthonos hydrillicola CCALA 1050]MDR9894945.1 hypothetical protein [Aetokthonos hydrillicola Thurmond2011]
MSLSNRNRSQLRSHISFKEVQKETNFWRSPLIWLCGFTGVLIVGSPLIMDEFTNRVTSAFMVDVSLSNQPYKTSLEALCHQYIEQLVEGDINIQGKFADKVAILNNQEFQERDRLSFQKQCEQISLQPPGIGKAEGTSLIDTLSRLETEIEHQQSQGNNQPVAAVIAIQAAEMVNHQRQDFNLIKSKIESIVQKGGAVVMIGPEVDLQNQLSRQLMSVKNTQICTYSDSQTCLSWLFQKARK